MMKPNDELNYQFISQLGRAGNRPSFWRRI
nr:MAG TPA: hypothetical protein [Caudoviricetes sp.]